MSAHDSLLAATIVSFVAMGVPGGLLLGARRAGRGRLPLSAPTDSDERARLTTIGQSLKPKATVGLTVLSLAFVALLTATILT